MSTRKNQGRAIKSGSLGRALVNDRRRKKANQRAKIRFAGPNLVDEHDTDAGALESVLQETDLDDFLMKAMMSGREFTAEKENTIFLGTTALQDQELHEDRYDYEHVAIPRRPKWDRSMTKDEVHENETQAYLEWRGNLAEMEENTKDRRITPYEKNLEVWRQLWRVVERSDVVIQIVDARNPLLFRSEDLEKYVKEVDPNKHVLLLINKADLLSLHARKQWTAYFRSQKIPFLFFSALEHERRRTDDGSKQQQQPQEDGAEDSSRRRKKKRSVLHDDEEKDAEDGTAAGDEGEEDDDDDHDDGKDKRRKSSVIVDLDLPGQSSGRRNPFALFDEEEDEEVEKDGDGDDGNEEEDTTEEEEESSQVEVQETENASAKKDDDEEERIPDNSLLTSEEKLEAEKVKAEEELENDDDGVDEEIEEKEEEEEEEAPIPMSTSRILNREQLLRFLMHHYGQHILALRKEMERREQSDTTAAEAVDQDGGDGDGGEEKDWKKKQKPQQNTRKPLLTIGMVGYPNVGKSSTINVLLQSKKVSVAPTPGKTKHFQTHFLPDDPILLCDCPGLVFPTFAYTGAELVLNGILSVDHLRDWQPSIALLCRKIGRLQIKNAYGIELPPNKEITPVDLLEAYAKMRGFMRAHGTPDFNRCARILLKDAVSGKLVCCTPPPGLSPEQIAAFHDSYRSGAASLGSPGEEEEEEELDEEAAENSANDNAAGYWNPTAAEMPSDALSRVLEVVEDPVEEDFLLQSLLRSGDSRFQSLPRPGEEGMHPEKPGSGGGGSSGGGGGGGRRRGNRKQDKQNRKEMNRQKKQERRMERQKGRNRFRGVEPSDSRGHIIPAFGIGGQK